VLTVVTPQGHNCVDNCGEAHAWVGNREGKGNPAGLAKVRRKPERAQPQREWEPGAGGTAARGLCSARMSRGSATARMSRGCMPT